MIIYFKSIFIQTQESHRLLTLLLRQKLSTKHILKDRTMFLVRYDEQKDNIELTFKFQLSETRERDFTFNRKGDETLSKTFQKFQSSIAKYAQQKRKKSDRPVEEFVLKSCLMDTEKNTLSEEISNRDAWKDNYKLTLNNQSFTVLRDAPHVHKLKLQECLISNLPVTVSIECDEKIQNFCKFFWYYSKSESDVLNTEWIKLDAGINKKMIVPRDECVNRYLKVECIPSDGTRDGLISLEKVSKTVVKPEVNLSLLPMTKRHKLIENKLKGEQIRVVTYNILAQTYSDTEQAKTSLFPYCPLEYLDFEYRRILLIHELINYNADIIFLQEVDEMFFEHDIRSALYPLGYTGFMRIKGNTKEGEVILVRENRFKFVDSTTLSIKLTDELKRNHRLYNNLWSKISTNDELKEQFDTRNSILQVSLIESLEKPNNFILLANTHFFYHPKADFIRLLQAIISAKYLEQLVDKFREEGKNVSVIFAGDFNSDPESHAFNYLFSQQILFDKLTSEQQSLLGYDHDSLAHRLQLSTFTNFEFTNFIETFNCILDYIFYDSNSFDLSRVIAMPSREEVTKHVALPSVHIPSDHLAIIFELTWKNK